MTSLIKSPAPKPIPRVTPTTAIVEAFSPTPRKFKKGFRAFSINLSTPIYFKKSKSITKAIIIIKIIPKPFSWDKAQLSKSGALSKLGNRIVAG